MACGGRERKWPGGPLLQMAVDDIIVAPACLMLWPTARIYIRGAGLGHAGLDRTGQGTDKRTDQGGGAGHRRRLKMAKSSREGSDFGAGKGELLRGRGRGGPSHQAEQRGALALG